MSMDFNAAIKHRRSIYGISKEQVVSDDRIREVVSEAVNYTPSSFNSQSSRVVILLNEQHDKLWDLTKETLRKLINNEEQFSSTADRMAGFRNGYGTILFFEDQAVIKGLQEQFATYKDNFPVWSNHSAGMLQFVVWTSLELEGFGASLQHYNPLIDDQVKQEWNIPAEWKLLAQMPFGKPTAQPGEKQFMPIEERVKFFN
ncbi:nitroreductase family protein [Paenibacillus sp. GCM10027626]|uniref:nitroreductase family protein n=1 Tax=Paenibacillus sp. GCM10027626 TaxID=3273411 RepID=UPI00362C421A